MSDREPVILVTGSRKGIGRHLVQKYLERGHRVFGCSRNPADFDSPSYRHFCLDVADEVAVKRMLAEIRKSCGRLDVLINNAGTAAMNHFLLTPVATAEKLLRTNFLGTFLLCRESAKLMQRNRFGRIVNFTTVAVPLQLEGEAAYAASKAAVETLTRVLARELAQMSVTVNAVGPTPIDTDLLRGVPREKLDKLIRRQAIRRFGEYRDVANVIDFFVRPESDFVTGQILYLGGV